MHRSMISFIRFRFSNAIVALDAASRGQLLHKMPRSRVGNDATMSATKYSPASRATNRRLRRRVGTNAVHNFPNSGHDGVGPIELNIMVCIIQNAIKLIAFWRSFCLGGHFLRCAAAGSGNHRAFSRT
jgi:hypothetical protein